MKKYLYITTVSLAALTCGAVQAEENWYAGIEGGLNFAEKSNLKGGNTSLLGNASHDDGYVLGGVLGYDFGGVRLEGELARRHNGVDKYTFSNDGGIGAAAGVGSLNGVTNADEGSARVTSGMMNVLIDIGKDWAITPYVGAGFGAAKVKYNNFSIGAADFVDDSDTVFAYQMIAGLSKAISKQVDISLDYRYFATDDPKVRDGLGRRVNADYSAHTVMLGLRYKFGMKAEKMAATPEPIRVAQPVEPEPAPYVEPAPEPEVIAQIEPAVGPYVVYFDWDDAKITDAAAATIAEAAEAAKSDDSVAIILKGHADTSGPASYNEKLSASRAAAVKARLVTEGVDSSSIETRAYGENELPVPTVDGVREQANRQVQILLEK
jgi:outer membrane protein OmpA-like peptidoglycan-associated protein